MRIFVEIPSHRCASERTSRCIDTSQFKAHLPLHKDGYEENPE